MHIYLMV